MDFEEYALGGDYTIQDVTLSAKGSYAPEFTGSNKSAYYLESKVSYASPVGVSVTAHYGYSAGDHFDAINNEYSDYSLGISTKMAGFGFDLSGYTNDFGGTTPFYDDRLVFTLSKDL